MNNDPQKLAQHTLVEERSVDSYLLQGWRWNEGRYHVLKSVKELADSLNNVRCLYASCSCTPLRETVIADLPCL